VVRTVERYVVPEGTEIAEKPSEHQADRSAQELRKKWTKKSEEAPRTPELSILYSDPNAPRVTTTVIERTVVREPVQTFWTYPRQGTPENPDSLDTLSPLE
jgi:hypothetical protein